MSPLADYFHQHYLHHHKGVKLHQEGLSIQIPCVKIPKATITQMKVFCLAGIVAACFVPPQYAWAVVLVTNGYWMFKL